ncbi:MAG: hypothetical protein DI582_10025 [Azospirillum brasilense]|nr:MAG: hypothetical protein DI582_10025 [Azospirillum brasilense]
MHAAILFSGMLFVSIGAAIGLCAKWNSAQSIRRFLLFCILLGVLCEVVMYAMPYQRDYANPSLWDDLSLRFYIGLAILINAALFLLLPRVPQANARLLFLTILTSTAGVVAMLLLWSYATAWVVQWRVVQTAGLKPYCVQVRGYDAKYRPATTLSDLRGFRMQGKWNHGATSYKWQDFHAVLIVQWEDDLHYYNWSYLRQNFVPITKRAQENLYLLRPSCEPTSHFLSTLN